MQKKSSKKKTLYKRTCKKPVTIPRTSCKCTSKRRRTSRLTYNKRHRVVKKKMSKKPTKQWKHGIVYTDSTPVSSIMSVPNQTSRRQSSILNIAPPSTPVDSQSGTPSISRRQSSILNIAQPSTPEDSQSGTPNVSRRQSELHKEIFSQTDNSDEDVEALLTKSIEKMKKVYEESSRVLQSLEKDIQTGGEKYVLHNT